MTYRVVVSDSKVVDRAVEASVFDRIDAEMVTTGAQAPEEVVEAAEGAHALLIDAGTQITASVVEQLAELKVIGRAGIGVDNIDVAAAASEGVTVVHVPDYCVDEVSTHTLALILGCLRKVAVYDQSVKAGEWDWSVGQPIRRLDSQTIGIVGFGKIPRRLAAKLQGFNVDVLGFDPYVQDYRMRDFGVEQVSFDALLARADIVSVHVPLTNETRGMFSANEFRAMQEDAIFVNTARGPVVDEAAIVEALDEGEIASAGLDVLETEPPAASPLFDRDNVILTPHTAWYSEESRRDLSRTLAEDIVGVLQGEPPMNRVDPDSGWYVAGD